MKSGLNTLPLASSGDACTHVDIAMHSTNTQGHQTHVHSCVRTHTHVLADTCACVLADTCANMHVHALARTHVHATLACVRTFSVSRARLERVRGRGPGAEDARPNRGMSATGCSHTTRSVTCLIHTSKAHACLYTCLHAHVSAHVYIHMSMRMSFYTHAYMHMSIYTCLHTSMHMSAHMSVH